LELKRMITKLKALFRSLVCICDTTVLHLVSLQKTVTEQRGSFVFRLAHYCKELEAFAKVVDFLNVSLPLCIENYMSMPSGSLFPPLQGSYDKYHEILRDFEQLDSTCFYGRPLGFQFSPSVNRIFRVIGIVLASYSLSWEKGHGAIGSIINTGRFFLSPEQRASRIIKVTKEADIEFCKGFWNLAELSNVSLSL
uniref:HSL_N domain-containing protein n=1 Tax=Angiostrongylus cantonensis TaxID=6313 RepID=A0A0K0DRD0_ANGCA